MACNYRVVVLGALSINTVTNTAKNVDTAKRKYTIKVRIKPKWKYLVKCVIKCFTGARQVLWGVFPHYNLGIALYRAVVLACDRSFLFRESPMDLHSRFVLGYDECSMAQTNLKEMPS